ncbi:MULTISPECIES: glutathione S-transferase C-terminal domain-containing protein [Thermomonas]|jgi:GST-like protein|uniref:glutathione S-transferase C-terminal domain-containing protein n=1 Tax=Thermomonas TaxID=141948 RepID=UPI00042867CC|nr:MULTISPECIES: glutathione S-transferase C-terminal domain-containing protein [Thermomonas]
MIDLYYWPTPNGHKITLLLEEAGLPYVIHPVDIGKGAQFEPAFLAISPNNKMPAIVDRAPADGGEPISVFESGAILRYLSDKAGRFTGVSTGADAGTALRQRIVVDEWLFWQMAGLGPMTGQYGHFHVYAPEVVPYARERYRKEAERLLGVLDRRLQGRAFIAGDDYSIADIACYPWVGAYTSAPLDLAPFANVRRWREAIAARPATQRAYALAQQVNPDAGKPMSDEEKKILFGQGPR